MMVIPTKYIISYSLLAGTKVNIVNLYTVDDIREWLKDPVNVYIGRQTRLISGSKWGNPYRMIDYEDNREEVIDLYEMYLAENPELLNSVGELRDKVLGCWCSPQACHGEILHRLAGNHPVYASKEQYLGSLSHFLVLSYCLLYTDVLFFALI